jgi:hypothetical protein
MCILNVVEDVACNQCTSEETCKRLSMTFSQASGRASVELSEHEHSAMQTLTEH